MSQTFVNLHSHSSHSFLDGFSSVGDIAARAADIGMTALAITDHGEVSGQIDFQIACNAYGVKPIFGMEGYLIDYPIGYVRENKIRENSHIILLAENQQGLRNLWTISSRAYIESRYYKPLSHWDVLKEHSAGLIATDGCLLSYMAKAILADDEDRQVELIGKYIDTFGEDNFFMELHTWQFTDPTTEKQIQLNADMAKVNQGKVRIATKYGIPLIVVNDSHYACEDEWEEHALVWQISTSKDDQSDSGRTAAWIMTDDEVIYWMDRHGVSESVTRRAMEATRTVAERCNVVIEGGSTLPTITGSQGADRRIFIDHLEEGFQRKVVDEGLDAVLYMSRVEEELDLILPKNFDGYFNVVADYSKYAKNVLGMLLGASRGSSGGSLVAFLLDINEIDPIKYDLLFARFLTQGRTELPDIDLDFPQSRRGEIVLSYLPSKYGVNNVCSVGTISRSKPKGALKDLCRVMKVPFADSDAMGKIVEQVDSYDDEDPDQEDGTILSLDEIIKEKGGDLLPWVKKYPKLFEELGKMIGMIRQSSSHASGVLISNESFLGTLPLRIKGDQDKTLPVSQFENSETFNTHIVWLGFVKFDILGLRHLDTLQVAREIVLTRHGREIDYYKFGAKEYEDPAIYEEIGRGETLGLFQIETELAASVCAKFKPMSERDIADLISVDRPGVIKAGMLQEYLDRREGLKPIKTPHPIMDRILARSLGVVVYQEDIMLMFQQLAGYSLEEADEIRKIMGKKKMDKMKEKKEEFVQRCLTSDNFTLQVPRGKTAKAVALKCWDQIEPSAGYSFGKGHAQGYAFITVWEAWMKHYYPEEFYTALMITDPAKSPSYIREAKKKGINILPPDINDSGKNYTLTDDGIRYGLTAIRGVADKVCDEIDKLRPFSSFEDVLARVPKRAMNSAVGFNLISIGAFDRFGEREEMLDQFIQLRKIKGKSIPDFHDSDVVARIEKELVGSYITQNPIERYSDIIEEDCVQTPQDIEDLFEGEIVNVAGMITLVKRHQAKSGPMAWVGVEWRGDVFNLVIFPKYFAKYKYFLEVDTPVICQVERLKRGAQIKELVRLDRRERK